MAIHDTPTVTNDDAQSSVRSTLSSDLVSRDGSPETTTDHSRSSLIKIPLKRKRGFMAKTPGLMHESLALAKNSVIVMNRFMTRSSLIVPVPFTFA